MATIDVLSMAEFIRVVVLKKVWMAAAVEGGCGDHCRFDAEYGFDPIDVEHVFWVRHNGRRKHRAVVATITGRETLDEVLSEFMPWLRGLHRFPVESGIK